METSGGNQPDRLTTDSAEPSSPSEPGPRRGKWRMPLGIAAGAVCGALVVGLTWAAVERGDETKSAGGETKPAAEDSTRSSWIGAHAAALGETVRVGRFDVTAQLQPDDARSLDLVVKNVSTEAANIGDLQFQELYEEGRAGRTTTSSAYLMDDALGPNESTTLNSWAVKTDISDKPNYTWYLELVDGGSVSNERVLEATKAPYVGTSIADDPAIAIATDHVEGPVVGERRQLSTVRGRSDNGNWWPEVNGWQQQFVSYTLSDVPPLGTVLAVRLAENSAQPGRRGPSLQPPSDRTECASPWVAAFAVPGMLTDVITLERTGPTACIMSSAVVVGDLEARYFSFPPAS